MSYLSGMKRLPPKYAEVQLATVQEVVAQLVAGKGMDEIQQDDKALEAAQVGSWSCKSPPPPPPPPPQRPHVGMLNGCPVALASHAAVQHALNPTSSMDGTNTRAAHVAAPGSHALGQAQAQEALTHCCRVLLQAVLSDLWRWRRRGGGARLEEGELPHMVRRVLSSAAVLCCRCAAAAAVLLLC